MKLIATAFEDEFRVTSFFCAHEPRRGEASLALDRSSQLLLMWRIDWSLAARVAARPAV